MKTRKPFSVSVPGILAALLVTALPWRACCAADPTAYPTPPPSSDRLFYIQRSTNSNTVVYDANRRSDGSLDPNHPVTVYWLRYNTTGERKPLKYVEKAFAYGVESEPLPDGGYRVNLVSYRKRWARVMLNARNKAEARMDINGQAAILHHAYITVDEHGFWPDVTEVDLYGTALSDGTPLHERFEP